MSPRLPELTDLKEVARLLEAGTRKGTVKWAPEEPDTECFSAAFDSGTVRISRILVGSTYLLEMLDLQGHTFASVESSRMLVRDTKDRETYDLLEQLYRCARSQALGAEDKMGALLEELRRRAGEGPGGKG
jgi:hypothetical protein